MNNKKNTTITVFSATQEKPTGGIDNLTHLSACGRQRVKGPAPTPDENGKNIFFSLRSPSSEGVGQKTWYLGLSTSKVLLIFVVFIGQIQKIRTEN